MVFCLKLVVGSWSACALLGEHILKPKGTVPRKLGPTGSLNKLVDFNFPYYLVSPGEMKTEYYLAYLKDHYNKYIIIKIRNRLFYSLHLFGYKVQALLLPVFYLNIFSFLVENLCWPGSCGVDLSYYFNNKCARCHWYNNRQAHRAAQRHTRLHLCNHSLY